MSGEQDLEAIARAIIDSNSYMTLGTVDEDGRPWVSPVYYSTDAYREFFWVSDPEAAHSRNIAQHSQISIVIFNSTVRPGTGQAVYMSAEAREVATADVARCIVIFSRGAEARGAWVWTEENVRPPALIRLYRATVTQHWILCPRTTGQPCPLHGRAVDHRTPVSFQA